MQTDLWYELELVELAGSSAVEDLIRDAEAAQFSANVSEDDEPDGDEPGA